MANQIISARPGHDSPEGLIAATTQELASILQGFQIEPATFERVWLNALVRMPKLANCSQFSLQMAVVECAEAGLLPNGKQACILPFGNDATFVPMIEGRLLLARRAMPALAIKGRCVFTDDEFEYEDGLDVVLRHVPSKRPDAKRDWQSIVAAYAVAKIPGGDREFEVLMKADLARYRQMAPSGKSDKSIWSRHPGEACEKTALGQLLKRLPKGTEAGVAHLHDGSGAEVAEPLTDDDWEAAVNMLDDEPAPGASAKVPPEIIVSKTRGRRRARVEESPAAAAPVEAVAEPATASTSDSGSGSGSRSRPTRAERPDPESVSTSKRKTQTAPESTPETETEPETETAIDVDVEQGEPEPEQYDDPYGD